MRQEKISIVGEYSEKLKGSAFVFLTDYRGLTVEQLTQLRGVLKQYSAQFNVVSNGLLQVALKGIGWADLAGQLDGPIAMISGTGDASATAKAVRDFCKENKLPVFKGGRMDDALLSAGDVVEIADIPPRPVMLARLVGTIAAPMQQLVGVLNQKVSSLVYVLKAVEEKKSK